MNDFLGTLTLERGAHPRGQGMCAMEAAAYLAGEPHSDHPECVSPVIAAFMRRLNDRLSEKERQQLKPWIGKVLHTRGTEAQEKVRGWMAADWAARERLPFWLDRMGKQKEAEKLRKFPVLSDKQGAERIRPLLQKIYDAAADDAAYAADDAAAYAAYAAAYAADAAAYAAAYAADDAADAAAYAADDATYAATELPLVFSLLERMIAVTTPIEQKCELAKEGRVA